MKNKKRPDAANQAGESLEPTLAPLEPPRAAVNRLLQAAHQAAAAPPRSFAPPRWLWAIATLLAAALLIPWMMMSRSTDPTPEVVAPVVPIRQECLYYLLGMEVR